MQLFQLRSVLVATDLGEPSLPAVRTAIELARLSGARLHLLHVADATHPDAEAQLRNHARLAAPGDIKGASVRVAVGSPSAEIVTYAARVEADVIVLGPHRPNRRSASLGSTATAIVDAVACPCLIVAGNLRLPLERVMAPIDFSEAARGTLAVALTWASALRRPSDEAELTVLHVSADSESGADSGELHAEVERIRAWAGGAARVRMREQLFASDDTAREILDRASDGAVDLIVMGTGASAAERDTPAQRVGRVTTAVIHDTPRPVLVVPPRVWRQHG